MAQGGDMNEYDIPQSRGIPPFVIWLFSVGVFLIFFMGVISFIQAGENHYYLDVTTKPLTGSL
jgi:hypothetical protein